jgi:hypothetical protein
MADPNLPEPLRHAVARTLVPVRPLLSPARRAALFLPLALALLASVPLSWTLRLDATTIGPLRLWGGSLAQVAVGILVLAAALGESIPGRLPAPRSLAARAALGATIVLTLTAVTFLASPTHVPAQAVRRFFIVCLTRSVALGLLPLATSIVLLQRGLLTRPVVAGALAGLGAGLLADAGWRLACEVSDPAHVLTAHAGAIVLLAGIGAIAALIASKRGVPR